MFEVTVEETFSAGHALRGYHGKCENPHGHNYRVRLLIRGGDLDGVGLLADFHDLKSALRGLIARYDHQFLNDLEDFRRINPSAENIAQRFFQELRPVLAAAPNAPELKSVTVYETDTAAATYSE